MQSKRRDLRTEPKDSDVKERRESQQREACGLGEKHQSGKPRNMLSCLALMGYSSHRVGIVLNTKVPWFTLRFRKNQCEIAPSDMRRFIFETKLCGSD